MQRRLVPGVLLVASILAPGAAGQRLWGPNSGPDRELRPANHESSHAVVYDLLIRRAKVFDGSGNPWFYADVAVKDGRIAAIGDLAAASASRTIDAAGRFLAPGFIDIHSHSDRGLGDPNLRYNLNMIAQGITLSVVNQDGRSPWPIRDQRAHYEKQGVGSNVALMVGHARGLHESGALVEEGMRNGAYGVSTCMAAMSASVAICVARGPRTRPRIRMTRPAATARPC